MPSGRWYVHTASYSIVCTVCVCVSVYIHKHKCICGFKKVTRWDLLSFSGVFYILVLNTPPTKLQTLTYVKHVQSLVLRMAEDAQWLRYAFYAFAVNVCDMWSTYIWTCAYSISAGRDLQVHPLYQSMQRRYTSLSHPMWPLFIECKAALRWRLSCIRGWLRIL